MCERARVRLPPTLRYMRWTVCERSWTTLSSPLVPASVSCRRGGQCLEKTQRNHVVGATRKGMTGFNSLFCVELA